MGNHQDHRVTSSEPPEIVITTAPTNESSENKKETKSENRRSFKRNSKNDSNDTLTVAGHKVILSAENGINIGQILRWRHFIDWVAEFEKPGNNLELTKVHFQSVDMFGKHIGFVKFKSEVLKEGKYVPGIVFMRGPSVAILTILICEGKEYALTTVQARVPISKLFLEIPAGMLDDGTFMGKAASEMQEETGIVVKVEDLIDLTLLAYGSKYPGIYPSPGGCDEYIRLFLYRQEVSTEKLKQLEGKCTGAIGTHEFISLRVLPLERLWQETSDVKALSSLFLYEKVKHKIGSKENLIVTIDNPVTPLKSHIEPNSNIETLNNYPKHGNAQPVSTIPVKEKPVVKHNNNTQEHSTF